MKHPSTKSRLSMSPATSRLPSGQGIDSPVSESNASKNEKATSTSGFASSSAICFAVFSGCQRSSLSSHAISSPLEASSAIWRRSHTPDPAAPLSTVTCPGCSAA